jgi:hypothetical protein
VSARREDGTVVLAEAPKLFELRDGHLAISSDYETDAGASDASAEGSAGDASNETDAQDGSDAEGSEVWAGDPQSTPPTRAIALVASWTLDARARFDIWVCSSGTMWLADSLPHAPLDSGTCTDGRGVRVPATHLVLTGTHESTNAEFRVRADGDGIEIDISSHVTPGGALRCATLRPLFPGDPRLPAA